MNEMDFNDCIWTITSSITGSLKLTISDFRYVAPATETPATTKASSFGGFGSFDDFDWDSVVVEDYFGRKKRMLENPCETSYVEIFDGINGSFPRIGDKICGDTGQEIVTTTSNDVFVKFSFKSGSSLGALTINYTLESMVL